MLRTSPEVQSTHHLISFNPSLDVNFLFLMLKWTWECDLGLYLLWHVYHSHAHEWINGIDGGCRTWVRNSGAALCQPEGDLSDISVSSSCCKCQNLGILKQHKCTVSQFWRTDVQNDGVAKALPPWRLWVESFLASGEAGNLWPAAASFSLCPCRHVPAPMSLSL